jgi:hypothetical protein
MVHAIEEGEVDRCTEKLGGVDAGKEVVAGGLVEREAWFGDDAVDGGDISKLEVGIDRNRGAMSQGECCAGFYTDFEVGARLQSVMQAFEDAEVDVSAKIGHPVNAGLSLRLQSVVECWHLWLEDGHTEAGLLR